MWERNIVWFPPVQTQPGFKPATQVCALTRDWTCDFLVPEMMIQPTEPHCQGSLVEVFMVIPIIIWIFFLSPFHYYIICLILENVFDIFVSHDLVKWAYFERLLWEIKMRLYRKSFNIFAGISEHAINVSYFWQKKWEEERGVILGGRNVVSRIAGAELSHPSEWQGAVRLGCCPRDFVKPNRISGF